MQISKRVATPRKKISKKHEPRGNPKIKTYEEMLKNISEMLIKTAMYYRFTSIKLLNFDNASWLGCGDAETLICGGGSMDWYSLIESNLT